MTHNRTGSELTFTVEPIDADAAEAVRRRLDDKTKPVGSLGRIEEIAIRLAAIARSTELETRPRAVVIFAADHGVVARGVSAYPAEVTAQMVRNFAAGGAAVNVLARQMDARTVIVDMGVACAPEWPAAVLCHRLGAGTADMAAGPAMTIGQAREAVEQGVAIAHELSSGGVRVLLTGDMGIGNTTAAAALTAIFTGRSPEDVTGRGTGVDDRALVRKIEVVRLALDRNRPRLEEPLDALAKVGGFEIAALTGFILGAAAERRPVVLDGFIAGAAALVAAAICPSAKGYMIAGHRSAEPGHAAVLEHLGLDPLLDLGMRLGEGTGALMALPILDAARAILVGMSSFESAGVSRRERR